MAIASLVLSIAGLLCGFTPILGVIFGFVARRQIRNSGGIQTGDGLAIAGIIIGFILLALAILVGVLAATGLITINTKSGH